jgi:hypothetical protein
MCPSTPVSVNSGRKLTMMIAAAKDPAAHFTRCMKHRGKTAGESVMPVLRAFDMVRSFGHVAEDVFDHDDRRVDDKAEVERAHRQQVRAFPLNGQDQHGKGEREGIVAATINALRRLPGKPIAGRRSAECRRRGFPSPSAS